MNEITNEEKFWNFMIINGPKAKESKNNYIVAFEINSIYQYPKKPFINMAKEAGAKFSFGSNGHQLREVKNYDYCQEMVKECGLTEDDFFKLKL
ncbi:MAG: hypothetical protein HQ522_03185 [Bacteroidetes bacterium]|nr:hypothetical protein [Bacteroidota bacterium]